MTEVSLTDAFQEACTALGEAIVRERLLTKYAATLEAKQAETAPPDPED